MMATVRDFDLDLHANAVAELVTRISSSPISAEDFSHNIASWPPGQPVLRKVAESSGVVIGYLRIGKYCNNPKNAFMLNLFVDKASRKNGVGSELFDEALEFVKEHKASAIVSEFAESHGQGIAFAEKRKFYRIARLFNSYLDLTKYQRDGHDEAAKAVEERGYKITSLDKFDLNEKTRRAVFAAVGEADLDIPGIEYFGAAEWEEFDQICFKAKNFEPAGVAVAMRGEEFVGFNNIFKSSASKPGDMFTGFTGVMRAHRGQGLAYAMKVHGINYCLREDAQRLKTENDTRNEPMLAVNRKLGFVEHIGDVMYVRDLEGSE